MAEAIRVLVADDQALLRGSFRMLVDTEPDLLVVGEAGNGEEAVALADQLRPDVVLMDVRMPVLDGVAATQRICTAPATADVRVLILTMFDLDATVFAALRAGASGFLLKDTRPGQLLDAIRVVAAGDALLAPSVTSRLITAFGRPAGAGSHRPDALAVLTDREREVLRLVAGGLSNREIAATLSVSAGTVKTHVGHLLAKLRARDRAQLVITAYESGLVAPSTR